MSLGAAAVLLCAVELPASDSPGEAIRGKAIYEKHCQKCHGPGGWGDGPQAQWKFIPPANFHAPSSKLKSDEELLKIIVHGVIFTPMHSFRKTLSDTEMQDVVTYIRLLSQGGGGLGSAVGPGPSRLGPPVHFPQ